jgi:DnaK suppressor protein
MEREEEMAIDINAVRHRLEVEREHLLEELKSVSVVTDRRESGSYSEEGEFAAEIVEVGKELIAEKHIRNQLSDVNHALDKFEKGTYGVCDICGQPIEPARLEALPQASLCINCKSRQVKIRT